VQSSSGDFTFVQISDTHVGFKQAPNKNSLVTFQEAIAEINALPIPPDFVIHTGDMTHLCKAEEFDAAQELLKSIKVKQIFYVPGEHDELDDGQEF
jgi:3',5'-cyclic AMP phosphodiesterase CpdA